MEDCRCWGDNHKCILERLLWQQSVERLGGGRQRQVLEHPQEVQRTHDGTLGDGDCVPTWPLWFPRAQAVLFFSPDIRAWVSSSVVSGTTGILIPFACAITVLHSADTGDLMHRAQTTVFSCSGVGC